MEKNKQIFLYIIAFILSAFLLTAVIFYITSGLYTRLLWICYPALTFIILGILLKKSNLVAVQLLMIFIPDLFWILDFSSWIILGKPLFGITDYFFSDKLSLVAKIMTFQHLFTIPLTIWALEIMKVKFKPKLILFAFFEVMIIFFMTLVLPAENGTNCLPSPENCFYFSFPNWIPIPVIWVFLTISFILVSYAFIYFFFYEKKQR
jgi:hypothetical protein